MDDAEYEAYRKQVFERVWTELAPFEEQIENAERIPYAEVKPILTDLGLWGLMVPERHGGRGLTVSQYVPILAELAKVHGGIRVAVHVHNTNAHAITVLGSEEQQRALLPGIAAGTKSVAFALTEPDFGTGAGLGSTAVRDGGEYVLNGRKHLITNSDFATHFIYFAKTDPDAGELGVSAFLVERDAPGLSIEALPETMGCKGGEHGRITATDVRVAADDLLGEEGQGVAKMEHSLELSRVLVAASSLGTAERALDLAVEHSRTRVTFGKPLAQRQAIQRYIAEMAQDVYALKLMIEDCARKWDAGRRIPAEASMTKNFGLEAVGRVTDRALLTFGGIGYTRAHSIERLYRDARLNWLEEGTPTIQNMVVARAFVGGYSFADA
ncbi:acyl-CoA dehydrogenase family protein [Streptomyces sp. SRF1]|uniref:acyl-CoA dehydrogenase family protein n=1 Tax=Streptomyces sp. SRF1 TaxID=1549642 RepID=UPI0025B10C37|nr:acyl-CoA dehydrogenase family protein [Streptomyces sp. SRF1]MDN3059779.1 acyl-CoA dehydrogenase family protein [Streptomyces sp. SRF1]